MTHHSGFQRGDPEAIDMLAILAQRCSCRAFDGSAMDAATLKAIVADGTQAPSSCNQQQWHFIVVTDPAMKQRLCDNSGGNPHFAECSALVYLTFQKGWTHGNFSVVQGVAAAAYHMMLSAHLRGFSSILNSGIGPHGPVRELLGIPAIFELQGALAIGRPLSSAPGIKAPRRPAGTVVSFERFERPAASVYPAKPAREYPFFRITAASNPFAEWDPRRWSLEQLADFRGYAVWAKSPLAGVYVSRRQAGALDKELSLLGDPGPTARVAEIMPWGGTSTVALRRRLPAQAELNVVELAEGNLLFIEERLRQEGMSGDGRTTFHRMIDGSLPFTTESLDAVVFQQSLEHFNAPAALLTEAHRVLKQGGRLVVTARNLTSLYGLHWWRKESRAPVPNQGPFKPIPARRLRALVAERFRIEEEIGIGRLANFDDEPSRGPTRFLRRIYGISATKG